MRLMTCMAALMALVAVSGCGGADAGAGDNWIFYTYEEETSDGKTAVKYTVEEAVNVKAVSHATFYPSKHDQKDKQALLWFRASGKETKIYGEQAEKIWKNLQKNN